MSSYSVESLQRQVSDLKSKCRDLEMDIKNLDVKEINLKKIHDSLKECIESSKCYFSKQAEIIELKDDIRKSFDFYLFSKEMSEKNPDNSITGYDNLVNQAVKGGASVLYVKLEKSLKIFPKSELSKLSLKSQEIIDLLQEFGIKSEKNESPKDGNGIISKLENL